MAVSKEVKTAFASFQQAFKVNNNEECRRLFPFLRLQTAKFPTLDLAHSGTVDSEELKYARELLEMACMLALKEKDLPAFERYMLQLKAIFFDYSRRVAGGSAGVGLACAGSLEAAPLTGLYLLYLLASDRLGDFHQELELLTKEDHENESAILMPISIERCLMEGDYSQVLAAATGQKTDLIPDNLRQYAQVCLEKLLSTVRMQVGAALERAYPSLPVGDACRFLALKGKAELEAFAKSENERKNAEQSSMQEGMFDGASTPVLHRVRLRLGIEWRVWGDRLVFQKSAENKEGVAALEMISCLMGYAADMERII